MLFCQLGRADSLREICNGLGCCLGRLVHVGISRAPCRSTLSYANEHRPAALFEDLFFTALARFREQQGLGARMHKFRFKNKLLSMDSTTISLCLSLFPWAKFRRAKGGVKAHVLLDHDDYLPAYVLLTEAKRSDVKLADSFGMNPGSICGHRSRLYRLRTVRPLEPGRGTLCHPSDGFRCIFEAIMSTLWATGAACVLPPSANAYLPLPGSGSQACLAGTCAVCRDAGGRGRRAGRWRMVNESTLFIVSLRCLYDSLT